MKQILKIIALIELIGGAIASFYFAKTFGINVSLWGRPERDWLLTILIFISALFLFFVNFVILVSFYEILDNQEQIYQKLHQVTCKIEKQSEAIPPVDSWKCSKCGKYNLNYVGTCGCGNLKQ
ncbi:hypothetical protein [Lacrimispora brassicae]